MFVQTTPPSTRTTTTRRPRKKLHHPEGIGPRETFTRTPQPEVKPKKAKRRLRKPLAILMLTLASLPVLGASLAGRGSAPPVQPQEPAATAPATAPPTTLSPATTVVIETGPGGTLVQLDEPTTTVAAPTTTVAAPTTTAAAPTTTVAKPAPTTTTAPRMTEAAPTTTVAPESTPIDGPAEVSKTATRVNPQSPAQVERQRVERLLPQGTSYQAFMKKVDQLGLPSKKVTPELVGILTQPGNKSNIRQWDQVTAQTGVELHDLTTATIATNEQARNVLKWDSAVMENFLSQWGPELSGNNPAAIQKAARDFAARKMLGQHFHGNSLAFLQKDSSENPGWLDMNYPQGERAIWQDVIQRVTQVAMFSGRMETWNVPRPHGYDAIKATFGSPGTGQAQITAKIGPGGETKRVSAHNKIAPKVVAAFEEVNARGLSPHIHSFGGLYNYRDKRTSSTTSTHAWGIAIDLNSAEYPLGTPIAAADAGHHEIAKVLERYGFHQVEGDAHHFQYATGY